MPMVCGQEKALSPRLSGPAPFTLTTLLTHPAWAEATNSRMTTANTLAT
ncbi:hypothetical protein [Nitrosospira multiformis]|nr:hypothetical protein [Nitrosospira multiformis]